MMDYVGGYHNYDPLLGTLKISCCIIIGIQKGTIILTTTHVDWAAAQSLVSPSDGPARFRVKGCKATGKGELPPSRPIPSPQPLSEPATVLVNVICFKGAISSATPTWKVKGTPVSRLTIGEDKLSS